MLVFRTNGFAAAATEVTSTTVAAAAGVAVCSNCLLTDLPLCAQAKVVAANEAPVPHSIEETKCDQAHTHLLVHTQTHRERRRRIEVIK